MFRAAACVLQLTTANPRPVTNLGAMGVLLLLPVGRNCRAAANGQLQLLHLASYHSSLLPAPAARWGRAGLGFVCCAHHAGLSMRFRVLLLSRGAGVYTSPVTALLRLWVCSIGVHARRMPSFPWGVGSAPDVQLRFGRSYPPCYHGAARRGVWDRLLSRVPLVGCAWLPFRE